ncbi:MAG: MBL fold metallo-hydrolase [Candidatus Micrarchaeia archaeon]
MNLEVGETAISLDGCGRENCFVSHAHSDHITALTKRRKRILASEETFALAGYSTDVTPPKSDGVKFELLNSGHILGSRQLKAECDGTTLIYTGDFKLQDGLTTKGAEVQRCDVLVIESTYGSPQMVFPEREFVFSSMAKWVESNLSRGAIVLLGGYPIGKAQELIKFSNEYLGVAPVVESAVEKACCVYERFGVKLDRIPVRSEEAEGIMKGSFIAVTIPQLANRSFCRKLESLYGRKVVCAVASGWALKYGYLADRAFPLSDHADFNQLIEYVERASPKKVYCAHGETVRFASELRRRGYNAKAIEASQMTLNEFVEGD